jgi:transposase-like protein
MRHKLWSEDKQQLVTSYLEQGKTYAEIAKLIGMSMDAVEKATRRYSLRKGKNSKYDPTEDSDVIKIKKSDIDYLAKQLGEKMYDNYKTIQLIEPKIVKNNQKREEVSILTLSDAHIGSYNTVFDGETGKRTITYNEEIFKQEIQTLQNSVVEIHGILSHSYNLKKLVIYVLGDILTNDRIYEGQEWEIEKIVGLQLWDGVNYFTKFFNNLLSVYENIEVVCVVGNHGRSQPLANSDNEPVENNWEYHLYRIWQKQFEDSKRIKIIVPNTRRYLHKVNGWNHLIEHGDSINGFSEQALIKQIKELYINTKFDLFQMGHVHTIKEIEISDKIIAKINGAWIEKDNYAFRKFKTYSIPKQWFFGCNEHRPETWSYKLDLRKKKYND